MGNTPTGVGKTCRAGVALLSLEKHPHGRGEDFQIHFLDFLALETPPRAWGRLPVMAAPAGEARNTPTGVGKTSVEDGACAEGGKHPHGRGEDHNDYEMQSDSTETPPRAWGRHA